MDIKRDSSLGSKIGHRKIFNNVNPRKEEANVGLPRCYFHKDQAILKFCECRECTLPLCGLCEQIHLTEHKKQYTTATIRDYTDVRMDAYKQLQRLLETYKEKKQVMKTRIVAQSQKLCKSIKLHFDNLLQQLDNRYVSDSKIKEIQERQDKIRNGSIRALIQYYSQTNQLIKEPKLWITNSDSIVAGLSKIAYLSFESVNTYNAPHQASYQIKKKQIEPKNIQVSTPLSQEKYPFVSPIQRLSDEQPKVSQIKQDVKFTEDTLNKKYLPYRIQTFADSNNAALKSISSENLKGMTTVLSHQNLNEKDRDWRKVVEINNKNFMTRQAEQLKENKYRPQTSVADKVLTPWEIQAEMQNRLRNDSRGKNKSVQGKQLNLRVEEIHRPRREESINNNSNSSRNIILNPDSKRIHEQIQRISYRQSIGAPLRPAQNVKRYDPERRSNFFREDEIKEVTKVDQYKQKEFIPGQTIKLFDYRFKNDNGMPPQTYQTYEEIRNGYDHKYKGEQHRTSYNQEYKIRAEIKTSTEEVKPYQIKHEFQSNYANMKYQ